MTFTPASASAAAMRSAIWPRPLQTSRSQLVVAGTCEGRAASAGHHQQQSPGNEDGRRPASRALCGEPHGPRPGQGERNRRPGRHGRPSVASLGARERRTAARTNTGGRFGPIKHRCCLICPRVLIGHLDREATRGTAHRAPLRDSLAHSVRRASARPVTAAIFSKLPPLSFFCSVADSCREPGSRHRRNVDCILRAVDRGRRERNEPASGNRMSDRGPLHFFRAQGAPIRQMARSRIVVHTCSALGLLVDCDGPVPRHWALE